MENSRDDILAFIPRLEASRENLVDEIMAEYSYLRDLDKRQMSEADRQPREKYREERTSHEQMQNKAMAELADVHAAIAAFREEAERRQ